MTACSCWYLYKFQAVGDEVKGFYPLAYEDITIEARLVVSLILIPHLFGLCAFCFWTLFSFFQLTWEELQDLRVRPFSHVLRPSLRLEANKKGAGVQLSFLSLHLD